MGGGRERWRTVWLKVLSNGSTASVGFVCVGGLSHVPKVELSGILCKASPMLPRVASFQV